MRVVRNTDPDDDNAEARSVDAVHSTTTTTTAIRTAIISSSSSLSSSTSVSSPPPPPPQRSRFMLGMIQSIFSNRQNQNQNQNQNQAHTNITTINSNSSRNSHHNTTTISNSSFRIRSSSSSTIVTTGSRRHHHDPSTPNNNNNSNSSSSNSTTTTTSTPTNAGNRTNRNHPTVTSLEISGHNNNNNNTSTIGTYANDNDEIVAEGGNEMIFLSPKMSSTMTSTTTTFVSLSHQQSPSDMMTEERFYTPRNEEEEEEEEEDTGTNTGTNTVTNTGTATVTGRDKYNQQNRCKEALPTLFGANDAVETSVVSPISVKNHCTTQPPDEEEDVDDPKDDPNTNSNPNPNQYGNSSSSRPLSSVPAQNNDDEVAFDASSSPLLPPPEHRVLSPPTESQPPPHAWTDPQDDDDDLDPPPHSPQSHTISDTPLNDGLLLSSFLPSPSSYYYEYFYPNPSWHYEYMGRSIESLLFSHAVARAPLLQLPLLEFIPDDDLSLSNHPLPSWHHQQQHHHQHPRSSTGETSVNSSNYTTTTPYLSAAYYSTNRLPPPRRRHSSLDSFVGHIRSSISSSTVVVRRIGGGGGGTLANYHRPRRTRRASTSSTHSSAISTTPLVDIERRQSSSAISIPPTSSASSFSQQQQQQYPSHLHHPQHRRNSSIGINVPTQPQQQQRQIFLTTPVDVIIPNHIQSDHPRRNSSIASTYHSQQQYQQQQHQQYRFSASNRNHRNEGTNDNNSTCGPNVLLKIIARESTGKSIYPRSTTMSSSLSYNELQKLKYVTGIGFIQRNIDAPSRGMVTEIELLSDAIDRGDWNETYRCINRIETRLMSNNTETQPSSSSSNPQQQQQRDDPTLPRNAHRYYAGGGRNGYDRDIFTLCGGVSVLLRIFYEKAFVGQEMSESYDARDLTTNIVTTRLASCWIDVLSILRELITYIPSLMDGTALVSDYNFLPFLFTLLAHDSLFDAAATLIEEMLSIMSQTQQNLNPDDTTTLPLSQQIPDTIVFPPCRPKPTMTFFLGNVSDLYKLWRGFNCRQLAHFCRILAFLIFEPEDRQLLESPAVLKSIELLQLRRNRAVRAGYDSTVDMNQSILLGDETIIRRLQALLRTMNYAPSLSRLAHCNGMSLFPVVADTLFMVGLNELESWSEVDRQDALARTILMGYIDDANNDPKPSVRICDLGAVADMLETFMNTIARNERRVPPTHTSHIIQVLAAAQQAGVIVGRSRPPRRLRNQSSNDISNADSELTNNTQSTDIPVDDATVQGLESAAGILSEQVLIRRFFGLRQDGSTAGENSSDETNMDSMSGHHRYMINTPEDAANSLQFNAMLLTPYHVEVLFVLCTLLGGRRKLDAQDMMNRQDIVQVMDDMIQRLPWSDVPSTNDNNTRTAASDRSNHSGFHGPGCECTPENALCIQYLRLLHNFCDRDCENYVGRQMLLSDDERAYIGTIKLANICTANVEVPQQLPPMKYGLLRKVIDAFISESDESSYRFWLASCIEAFLRGSSMAEQIFVAQVGLMDHLLNEICSNRLHCAGSLQTSFDLLGEVGKGNVVVMEMMIHRLDESSLHKLMSMASSNLVDSNVFLRSMLIGLERIAALRNGTVVLHMDMASSKFDYLSFNEEYNLYQQSVTGSYLSFSWWDTPTTSIWSNNGTPTTTTNESEGDLPIVDVSSVADPTPTNWFPPLDLLQLCHQNGARCEATVSQVLDDKATKRVGWIFTPTNVEDGDQRISTAGVLRSSALHSSNIYVPNTLKRMHWFMHTNQAQLLHDLLSVVNLRNINHENICCLNTAVVVTIFAYRRNELYQLIHDLQVVSTSQSGQYDHQLWRGRRFQCGNATSTTATPNDLVHGMQSLRLLEESYRTHHGHYNILHNFRQVLWFWVEYYTHRGRDRLSLEYSSHLRYDDWISVVTILITYLDHVLLTSNCEEVEHDTSGDVSSSSILCITTDHTTTATSRKSSNAPNSASSSYHTSRYLLPRSPYQRAAYVVVGNEFTSMRGE